MADRYTGTNPEKARPGKALPESIREALLPAAVYLFLAVLFSSCFFSWNNLGSHSIQGGDPALNAWILQRVSHNLLNNPLDLLDGNAYYPRENSLTAWDHMTSLAVLNAPLQVLSTSPWTGYNLLILLAYFISAMGGYRLAKTLTGNRWAAFWAGIFWGFLFFRAHHFSHLQILSFQWIPYCADALISFLRTDNNRHLCRLVLFTLLQSLVGWYLAVINGFALLIVFTFSLGKKHFNWSTMARGISAALVIGLVMLPFVLAYGEQKNSFSGFKALEWTAQTGEQILPLDYLHPPRATLAGRIFPSQRYSIWGENTLYVGLVPLLLSLPGLCLLVSRRRKNNSADGFRPAALALALIFIGGVFSLGYNSLRFDVSLPWGWFTSLFPYFGLIRATPRFSLLVYLGILILSSFGILLLVSRMTSSTKKSLLTGGLSLLFLLEVFPFFLPVNTDRGFEYRPVDREIFRISREEGRELTVIYLLPTDTTDYKKRLRGEQPSNPLRVDRDNIRPRIRLTPHLLLGSTLHWARLLNGISFIGGPTLPYLGIVNLFPDERAVALLRIYDVDLVIFSTIPGLVSEEQLQIMLEKAKTLGPVIRVPDGNYILRMDRNPSLNPGLFEK